MQQPLFSDRARVQTKVIARKSDFDGLMSGFTKLQAITYVTSVKLLRALFDEYGFEQVEIVVSEDIAPLRRQQLAAEGEAIVDRLAWLVEQERLKVLIPKGTIHTKLYILNGDDRIRVIQTSANLSETARRASSQTNYAWYFDTDPGAKDGLLERVLDKTHTRRCGVFLEDLISLMREASDNPREKVIQAWLAGVQPTAGSSEAPESISEAAAWAMRSGDVEQDAVYTTDLPELPAARQRIQRALGTLGVEAGGRTVQVHRADFLRHIQEATSFPLMSIDPGRTELRLFVAGHYHRRSVAAPEPGVLDAGLQNIEDYFATVDWGETLDKRLAKSAMFEALLYLFAAPFAHEHMKVMRHAFGALDRRGPRILYLVGPSSNGKTTFLKFVLKLLSGQHVEPLNSSQFTKARISSAPVYGSLFPMVFDDVNPTQRSGFEEIVKSYWEVWWREDRPTPQIVISSNNRNLREWAKTRFKRIDFDVQFARTTENQVRLAPIFEEENHLFAWFSRHYLDLLAEAHLPEDDELALTRTAMRDLYDLANRSLPNYFPDRPLESMYNPDRIQWRDVLYRTKQAELEQEQDRIIVRFLASVQPWELREFETALPQTVKHRRRGNVITIESPEEFRRFLGSENGASPAWWRRILSRR